MKPDRWQQVDKLFEQALEQEPDRRGVFLDEACRGDDELRQEVSSLLSAHGRAEGFTEAGPMRRPAKRTSVEEAQLLTGHQIGHYQILSRLGEGGMGIVCKARDQHLDRFVAIKVLPPGLVADPDRKRRFVQEAKAASALNHPNVITIYDIASENGRDFIVMEYVDGKTLGQMIPRRGMKLNDALKVAIQIADALAKAQAAGIIHRDLKPGNIMVGEAGLVKILDFGLAKLTERPQIGEEDSTRSIPPWTDEGTILGTAAYMSPEQAAGKPVDARSDIFSFGSVLYEMVTGQRAFQGDSKMSTLAAVLNQEPKPASEISRALPRDLEKIISRCLRKDPSRRFQHMADLKVALEELKEESDSGTLQGAEAPVPSGEFKRRLPLLLVTVGFAVISLSIAGWFLLDRSSLPTPEDSFTVVPLTTYRGYEYSPSFSPDGNQVAFAWAKTGRDEDADIYIKQIGVEEPFRLTDHPAPDVNPAWSPDGRTIAFARYLSPQRAAYVVKPHRGGPERIIGEFFVSAHSAVFWARANCAWTPDSKSLIVVGKNTPEEPEALLLVSLETLAKRKLTDPPVSLADSDPAISADSRTLIFTRSNGEVRVDVCRLNLSKELTPQGDPERLTFDNRWSYAPAWAPEGREIILISGNTAFDLSLWRMAASKPGRPLRLAFAGDRVFKGLSLSRQGGRLAYSVWSGDTNISRIEVQGPGRESKETMKFIASTQSDAEPAYAPDGRRIAFRSYRSGSPEIWVCDSDGSHPEQLSSFGGPAANRPRWSPDGKQIVFYSNAKGNRDIYVIRADGGVPTQLTTHPSIDTNPNWSADGKWIYFQSDRSGSKRVWKVPVAGGDAVPVGEIGESSP
ncbi:MAG TPA: protein kinase, partial [Terriglobia bacterium]|nr:protein kinase [Terriglobia bacterium]